MFLHFVSSKRVCRMLMTRLHSEGSPVIPWSLRDCKWRVVMLSGTSPVLPLADLHWLDLTDLHLMTLSAQRVHGQLHPESYRGHPPLLWGRGEGGGEGGPPWKTSQFLLHRDQVGPYTCLTHKQRQFNHYRLRVLASLVQNNNREGSYQDETKCIPTTGQNSDSLLNTHSTVEDCGNVWKMKLNEPGRQNLGRQKPCKQAQHAKLCSDLPQAEKEGPLNLW